MADGARAHRHVLLDPLALLARVGLAVAALEVRDEPLERHRVLALAAHPVLVGDEDPVAARAVQEPVLLLAVELAPRRLEVDLVAVGDRLDDRLVEALAAERPRHERALLDREARVGDEQVGVDLELRAEPRAARAGAVRRVEREDARLQLGQRDAVLGAREVLAVEVRLAVDDGDLRRGPRRALVAVSTDCVRRWRRSGFITRRSTTTSIVCLNFLSRTISSSSSRCSPSTLTRVNPSRRSSSSTSRNSPLRSRTIGASTVNFVPSGSASTCSTIWSRLWPAIGRPQIGQCGRPTRA